MLLVIHKGVVILRTEDEKEARETYARARVQWPDDEILVAQRLELGVRKPDKRERD